MQGLNCTLQNEVRPKHMHFKENVQYYKYNKTMFIKGKKLKMYPLVQ